MKRSLGYFLLLLFSFGCAQKQPEQPVTFTSRQISQVIDRMTDIMVHDVTNPPLAARFFAYATLAGYEVISQNDTSFRSLHGHLNQYPNILKPTGYDGHSPELSALLAMMETAARLQPSGTLMKTYQGQFLDSCRRVGVDESVIQNSLGFAQEVSKQVLAYAQADRYNRISNYTRYSPTASDGSWYPTPPGFFAPVEPYFHTVRPFTLDTCSQFKPAPPAAFSTDENSAFYQLMQQAYRTGVELSEEQRQIAAFWDCNPFALQDNGHLMVGMKKISPGAHWLGITGIACQKANTPFAEAMRVHALVSVAITDGFLACWDEKFRSNRIRPETAIRKYLDPSWQPFLQTPPFPEYLSGHSTISSAAAVVLSHFFGENFGYEDTVEERFGLPARSFTSFWQAADEAGLSRLYGGIHFQDAIDNGRTQGIQVGEWVLQKVEGKAPAKGVVAQVK